MPIPEQVEDAYRLFVSYAQYPTDGGPLRFGATVMQWADGSTARATPTPMTRPDALVIAADLVAAGRERVDQTLPLTCTTPQFGGLRWWFKCPRCGTRCAQLLLPAGQEAFACRRCYGLRYRSQYESRWWRRIRRRAAAAVR